MDNLSVWAATANDTLQRSQLTENLSTDVVIIGAGFTGLSASLHLESLGIRTIVLEKETVGWGASGRNAGMILSGYKPLQTDLIERWGLEKTKQLFDFTTDSIRLVKEIVAKHQIACSLQNSGSVFLVTKKGIEIALKKEMDILQSKYGYVTSWISGKDMSLEINSSSYTQGLLDTNSYSFHPLNYTLGLARAAESLGSQIFEKSMVNKLQRNSDHFIAFTEKGSVKAKEVIIATDGYTTSVTKKLHNCILSVASFAIATEQLDKEFLQNLIPKNRMLYDDKNLLTTIRTTPDSRILFGGSGLLPTASNKYYQEVYKNMLEVFPQLATSKIEYRWGGMVGATIDQLPIIGKQEDGTYYATGYTGHGAAMATMLGKFLAESIAGENKWINCYSEIGIRPIPFSNQRSLLVNLANVYFRFLDAIGK